MLELWTLPDSQLTKPCWPTRYHKADLTIMIESEHDIQGISCIYDYDALHIWSRFLIKNYIESHRYVGSKAAIFRVFHFFHGTPEMWGAGKPNFAHPNKLWRIRIALMDTTMNIDVLSKIFRHLHHLKVLRSHGAAYWTKFGMPNVRIFFRILSVNVKQIPTVSLIGTPRFFDAKPQHMLGHLYDSSESELAQS